MARYCSPYSQDAFLSDLAEAAMVPGRAWGGLFWEFLQRRGGPAELNFPIAARSSP